MDCLFTVPVLPSIWLLLVTFVRADSNDSRSDDSVGWQTGPDYRGTLSLVWTCLSTIFACTWTVLHLNLPSRFDTTRQKVFRKIKWMAVNILFPEFIFSKSVCDLRLALEELRQFDEKMREKEWLSEWQVPFYVDHMEWVSTWRWKVKYPQQASRLYRLLCLKIPPNTALVEESEPPRDSEREPPVHFSNTQTWTVIHSYYAQMGGLLYWNGTHVDRNMKPEYVALNGYKLTSRFEWPALLRHPLDHLYLTGKDIQDKSKADLLAKGVAVLQITWLIFSIAIRGVWGLPITQLEIATIAFALMAIATYIVNWWKPKDVSEATILPYLVCEGRLSSEHRLAETAFPGGFDERSSRPFIYSNSFMGRLWLQRDPETDEHKRLRATDARVLNDQVPMEGEFPAMFRLLAASSLVFGGLHLSPLIPSLYAGGWLV